LKLVSSSNDDMTANSPKEYWTRLAENDRSGDAAGFSPVLHPNAPAWFNRLIDESQFRALRRALALAMLPTGSRALDVGCGTGRWIRRYEEFGLRATGVDATASMLRLARNLGTTAPLVVGEACRLPFPNARFDLVSDITVVQHIPASLQPQALGEMVRVIRPGGFLILMELIRGEGPLLFPRRPRDWIEQAASCGAKLVGWFGQEYLLFDRLFVRVALTLAGRNGSSVKAGGDPQERAPEHSTMSRRIYWGIRRVTVPLSAWADPITGKICPADFATHGVFVFRK
jgi:ubiquinone/menaquinone biosynthesis C-methylase UbiE